MFLKLKRDGEIKLRTVAGGNRQRDFISKEDASFPTVSTEELLLTCVIYTQEDRYFAMIDIPNASIQKKVGKEEYMVTIIVRGSLVNVLLEISPEV